MALQNLCKFFLQITEIGFDLGGNYNEQKVFQMVAVRCPNLKTISFKNGLVLKQIIMLFNDNLLASNNLRLSLVEGRPRWNNVVCAKISKTWFGPDYHFWKPDSPSEMDKYSEIPMVVCTLCPNLTSLELGWNGTLRPRFLYDPLTKDSVKNVQRCQLTL